MANNLDQIVDRQIIHRLKPLKKKTIPASPDPMIASKIPIKVPGAQKIKLY